MSSFLLLINNLHSLLVYKEPLNTHQHIYSNVKGTLVTIKCGYSISLVLWYHDVDDINVKQP